MSGLIAPSEPAVFDTLLPGWKRKRRPEEFGCDFLTTAGKQWFGTQRKEMGGE